MTKLRPAVLACLWLAAAIAAGFHLYAQIRTLGLEEPMGMWDTNYVSVARTWPHGYQWGNYVDGYDAYGPGYPTFVRPFLWCWSDPYRAHRVANLVALAAACIVLGLILRSVGCAPANLAALTALFFAINEGSYSVQGRPDFLVSLEMLILLGLGRPAVRARFRPVVFALLLGGMSLAAYLTKPYTLLGWMIVVAYGPWVVGWRQALWTAVISGLVLAAGVAGFAAANPYYIFETFLSHLVDAGASARWFVVQWRDFGLLTFGCLLPALFWVASRLRRGPPVGASAGRVPGERRYWLFAVGAGMLALIAAPAWHVGSYLTYHFHLLLPQLVVFAGLAGTADETNPGPAGAPWRELALAANLAVVVILAPAPAGRDPGWEALAEDIRRQPGHVVLDFIMEPLARQRDQVTLLGHGLTAYALLEPTLFKEPNTLAARAQQEVEAYEADLKERMFGSGPPAAIYLEVSWQQKNGSLKPVPRGGLAYLLGGHIAGYHVDRVFQIHPYFFATNLPRQGAGTWESSVLKLVPNAAAPPSPAPPQPPGGTSPHRG